MVDKKSATLSLYTYSKQLGQYLKKKKIYKKNFRRWFVPLFLLFGGMIKIECGRGEAPDCLVGIISPAGVVHDLAQLAKQQQQ